MDIAILNPRVTALDNSNYGSILEASLDMPPLGILYLATVLKKHGYEVGVFDINSLKNSYDRENVINNIITAKPKIIAISTMTPSFPNVIDIIKLVREELGSSCKIILGGYHVTFLPDTALVENLADIVVRGEGEYIMLELARLLIDKSKTVDLSNINGISFKANGKIVHNLPQIMRISDLNKIPFPDRNMLDMNSYNVPGTIMGSRGCIGKCKFCSAMAWGKFRDRDAGNLMNEIIYLIEDLHYRHICYIDNTFTVNPVKTFQLFDKINQRNMDCTFSLETRVNNIDEKILTILANNNVVSIQFGVESGDEGILKEMNKGISLKQVFYAVEKSLSLGMRVMCSFIIGHPTDTEESISNTIGSAKKLKKLGAQTKFEILTPYPGTDIFNNRDKYGLKILDWDFSKWGTAESIYETKHLTKKKINRLFKNAIGEVNAI